MEALDPSKWDQSISPFRLPKGLRLVLADVDAGTNTPSFIRGILKWREDKPEESNEIWGKLFKANTRLVKALEHLRDMEGEEEYGEVLEAAAGLPIEQVSLSSASSCLPPCSESVRPGSRRIISCIYCQLLYHISALHSSSLSTIRTNTLEHESIS